jgi:fumarate hydratase, class II
LPIGQAACDLARSAEKGHDETLVTLSGTLKTLAAGLMKIANDVCWQASGPRCGLGELTNPETGRVEVDQSKIVPKAGGKVRVGIAANAKQIDAFLKTSLMLVTALNRRISYDNAAKVAKKAHADGSSLKDACLALGLLPAEEFDQNVNPAKMCGPGLE